MTEKNVYNALPKLPGFDFPELHAPPSHWRHHYCTIHDGRRTVINGRDLFCKTDNRRGGECGGLSRAEIFAKFPKWKSLDDKVLRFFAYYMERVDESVVERVRVRKVKINFYITDGTIVVVETPAVVNSGLPTGTTVSRCRIDGVDIFSLFVGSTITIRGIVYKIVDCDAATRDFCAVMEMPQPEPLPYPEDAFEASVAVRKAPMDEHHIELRRTMNMTAALASGTHTTIFTPKERDKARNFFEHDREVLRFMAVWDKRLFKIQYYIADQTISVMLEHSRNDGRDPNTVFIRRTRIPKDIKMAFHSAETLNSAIGSPVQYISEEDLLTGQSVNLFTRDFYLFDCDAYTRDHYEKKGIKQLPYEKPLTEADFIASPVNKKALLTQPVAESREQAASYGIQFSETAKEKDSLKLIRYSNDVFRFAARHAEPKEGDEGRKFLMCYYLADDTVSLFEIVVANSGYVGGKCFARSAVPSINEPGKLYVGAKVTLAGVTYELTEMDERTKKYIAMGMPLMDESYFHINELIDRARHVTLQRFSNATDAFCHFRGTKEGLSLSDLRRFFVECGMRLVSEDELNGVMKRLDQDGDQIISLSEFTTHFLAQQFISDFTPKNETTGGISKGPLCSLRVLEANKTAAREADEAFHKLISQSDARRLLLIRAFRTTSENTYDGHLSIQDFLYTLKNRLDISLSSKDLDALVFKFYYTPGVKDWTARRLPVKEIQRLIML